MPIVIGLAAYCFSGHALIPSFYVLIKYPRMHELMATATFVLVLVCSLLVANSDYYTFGKTVVDQVTISLAIAPIENGGQAMRSLRRHSSLVNWEMNMVTSRLNSLKILLLI
jgi:hypothetical protein